MTYDGIDTAYKITADIARQLKDNGYKFIARYLVPNSGSTAWKALTKTEADTIREAGLAVMPIWETASNRVKGGETAGKADAKIARKLAKEMEIPAGTIIYFAADYDVPASDLSYVKEYYKTAQEHLGEYVVGVYGGERVCTAMSALGFPVWQCVAWTNRFIGAADVIQYEWQGGDNAKALTAIIGIPVDLDSAKTMDGMWKSNTEAWYEEPMKWAMENGIIADGEPTDVATKADIAQMCYYLDKRYSGLLTDEL